MKVDIIMPKMGESVTEGTIIKWHKKAGEQVKKDEIIYEISTDKVDTEVPSQAAGILAEVLFGEGETVAVGTVVARIETDASAETTVISAPTQPETLPDVPHNAPVEVSDAVDVIMPKMGESVMEGTIIKWHKQVGEIVKKDEILFEISTDKVDTEVPSPAEGTIVAILAKEQETVAVGVVVCKISASGTVHIQSAPKTEPITVQEPAMHDAIAANALRPREVPQNEEVHHEVSREEGTGFFTPLVLSIAKKEGITFDELNRIPGTGAGGRVSKKDVLAYLSSGRKHQAHTQTIPSASAPAPSIQPQVYAAGSIETIPMDNIRQRIMQHMVKSRDTSVHVTGLIEVDMTAIHSSIQKRKDEFIKKYGVKLTYMAFIANAAVRGLQKYPLMNASIEGTNIVKKRFINLGIAVAVEPNGLIVPNIKQAHEKNIIGLAGSINDLAERARNKKLTPDDISGGTFTITNYGVFGTVFGTPIINQPEVAILGVGAVIKKPVVIEVQGQDVIAIKPIMALTLSHDHRLVDGMLGGLYLKFMKETLEGFQESSII